MNFMWSRTGMKYSTSWWAAHELSRASWCLVASPDCVSNSGLCRNWCGGRKRPLFHPRRHCSETEDRSSSEFSCMLLRFYSFLMEHDIFTSGSCMRMLVLLGSTGLLLLKYPRIDERRLKEQPVKLTPASVSVAFTSLLPTVNGCCKLYNTVWQILLFVSKRSKNVGGQKYAVQKGPCPQHTHELQNYQEMYLPGIS